MKTKVEKKMTKREKQLIRRFLLGQAVFIFYICVGATYIYWLIKQEKVWKKINLKLKKAEQKQNY